MSTLRASDATQPQVAGDFGHRCGICNKVFDRRDLRDRHKRRCVQTFNKPKKSKKRSCRACAISKLGCDQEQPSCRRCSTRKIICEYEGDTAESTRAASVGDDGSLMEMDGFLPEDDNTMISPNGSMSETASSNLLERVSPLMGPGQGLGAFSIAMNDVIAAPIHEKTRSPVDTSIMHQRTPSWNLGFENAGSSAFPLSNDLGLGLSSTGNEWAGMQLDKEGSTFAATWGAVSTSPSNTDWLALGNPTQPNRFTQHLQRKNQNPSLSPEAMADIIMGYLPMMVSLSSPRTPPFIHGQIYRCEDGDVKEPIARAMICINAHSSAMPSGRNFVYEMVNKERDGLIKSFPEIKSEIDILAALHAMIVYQALGFFSGSAESIRRCELHHPFLLKMVRKVARKYRDELINNASSPTSSSWHRWTIIETLRRTIFLVHAINVVSARLQKQTAFFYEPLDADLILDMPLPASRPLWDASHESQWLTARMELPQRPLSGRVLQQDHLSRLQDSDTFTRMIIATLTDDGIPDA